jgi:hypothetical protein
MARSDRFAAGYFFMGISVGASLAIQEIAGRRPNGGDIRGRTTGSAQAGRQGPAAPGTPLRHGPDKFISANNYTAEQSATVHSRPASPSKYPAGWTPKMKQKASLDAFKKTIFYKRSHPVWGPEVTE